MKKLDNYSQRFAKVLFDAFPEWKQFASVETEEESDEEGYLLVEVPAPTKGSLAESSIKRDFLTIYSHKEITVAFDYYHSHFDMFEGEPEDEGFNQAIEFIRSFIDEQVCAVMVLNGGEWCGSMLLDAGEKPNLSDWGWLSSSCEDVYVRSWKGTYDHRYNISELRARP